MRGCADLLGDNCWSFPADILALRGGRYSVSLSSTVTVFGQHKRRAATCFLRSSHSFKLAAVSLARCFTRTGISPKRFITATLVPEVDVIRPWKSLVMGNCLLMTSPRNMVIAFCEWCLKCLEWMARIDRAEREARKQPCKP